MSAHGAWKFAGSQCTQPTQAELALLIDRLMRFG
jgi:hypothetical protein